MSETLRPEGAHIETSDETQRLIEQILAMQAEGKSLEQISAAVRSPEKRAQVHTAILEEAGIPARE
jgi:hypothetical protein